LTNDDKNKDPASFTRSTVAKTRKWRYQCLGHQRQISKYESYM